MCQNNVNVEFSFTLSAPDASSVLAVIDTLVTWLLNAMRLNSTNINVVTFTYIRTGSAYVGGVADPSSGSSTTSASAATSATSSLSSALTGGGLPAGFTVTASSVVTNGVTSTTESSSNLPLIIGLSVGIPIAISTYFFI